MAVIYSAFSPGEGVDCKRNHFHFSLKKMVIKTVSNLKNILCLAVIFLWKIIKKINREKFSEILLD